MLYVLSVNFSFATVPAWWEKNVDCLGKAPLGPPLSWGIYYLNIERGTGGERERGRERGRETHNKG